MAILGQPNSLIFVLKLGLHSGVGSAPGAVTQAALIVEAARAPPHQGGTRESNMQGSSLLVRRDERLAAAQALANQVGDLIGGRAWFGPVFSIPIFRVCCNGFAEHSLSRTWLKTFGLRPPLSK